MRVLKFGGASVKDAESVRNIPQILSAYQEEELVVIISAMGKTTNALEALAHAAYHQEERAEIDYLGIYEYHLQIARDLFPDEKNGIFTYLSKLFEELRSWIDILERPEREHSFDFYYDQIVAIGELLSTRIVSSCLTASGIKNTWLDAREMIMTDKAHRAARIDWELKEKKVRYRIGKEMKNGKIAVSQGFIGSDGKFTTSLGREGSDFSAAIFANVLDASEVVVWKDVPGYMNADPKFFNDTVKLDQISYSEELLSLHFTGRRSYTPKPSGH